MRDLSFQNSVDVGFRALPRCLRHKRSEFLREGKLGFAGYRQHVRNLRRNELTGDTFGRGQADLTRGDSLQASAVVQLVGCRIPEDRVDIQEVVPQQLFDGVRLRPLVHVGVIFHSPEIEEDSSRTKAVLDSAERIS